jgi:hypothetical protein
MTISILKLPNPNERSIITTDIVWNDKILEIFPDLMIDHEHCPQLN